MCPRDFQNILCVSVVSYEDLLNFLTILKSFILPLIISYRWYPFQERHAVIFATSSFYKKIDPTMIIS